MFFTYFVVSFEVESLKKKKLLLRVFFKCSSYTSCFRNFVWISHQCLKGNDSGDDKLIKLAPLLKAVMNFVPLKLNWCIDVSLYFQK